MTTSQTVPHATNTAFCLQLEDRVSRDPTIGKLHVIGRPPMIDRRETLVPIDHSFGLSLSRWGSAVMAVGLTDCTLEWVSDGFEALSRGLGQVE